jgi:hypothetical protein
MSTSAKTPVLTTRNGQFPQRFQRLNMPLRHVLRQGLQAVTDFSLPLDVLGDGLKACLNDCARLPDCRVSSMAYHGLETYLETVSETVSPAVSETKDRDSPSLKRGVRCLKSPLLALPSPSPFPRRPLRTRAPGEREDRLEASISVALRGGRAAWHQRQADRREAGGREP